MKIENNFLLLFTKHFYVSYNFIILEVKILGRNKKIGILQTNCILKKYLQQKTDSQFRSVNIYRQKFVRCICFKQIELCRNIKKSLVRVHNCKPNDNSALQRGFLYV